MFTFWCTTHLRRTNILMLEKIIRFLKSLSLTKAAYNAFLKSIQRQVNHVKIDDSVSQFYVLLEKEDNNAVSYLIKRYDDGRITRTKLNESIDIELLPPEIAEVLTEEGNCKLDDGLFKINRT